MAKLSNKFPVKMGPESNWCNGSDRELEICSDGECCKVTIYYWGLRLQDSLA